MKQHPVRFHPFGVSGAVFFRAGAISCAMISRALLLLLAKQSSNIPEPFKESLELFNDRFFLDLAVSATAETGHGR